MEGSLEKSSAENVREEKNINTDNKIQFCVKAAQHYYGIIGFFEQSVATFTWNTLDRAIYLKSL